MKTLYFSDLDGTLLNKEAKLSEKTVKLLNDALKKDLLFTTATARTYSTVIPMFAGVELKLPLVLMNGVCLYDPVKRKTIDIKSISPQSGKEVVELFEEHNLYPLMYYEHDSTMLVEYTRLTTKSQTDYVSQRKNFYKKSFKKVETYTLDGSKNLVYIVSLDKKENLEVVHREILKRNDLDCNFYPDNYCDEYFLEIFHKGVSKASAALKVKNLIGADKIVAFGDNMNDIALFEVADEAYAVENACDELKAVATGIIGSNDADAVAEFINSRIKEK